MSEPHPPPISVRTDIRPGDVDAIVRLHGDIYAREYGFDRTFEDYVRGPLEAFARSASARERLWIAERDGQIVGSVAIVQHQPSVAQLRWYLMAPASRGFGLGRGLLAEAVEFARASRYDTIILWTVSALVDAARLYAQAGFRKVEERPGRQWGVDVVEERYELSLAGPR